MSIRKGTQILASAVDAYSKTEINNMFRTSSAQDTIDSNKANLDLSNLSTTGNNKFNAKQDVATALNYNNISNCITHIPQDIKLELNNGTLTLKSGSKVYVPNGAGVFDVVNITNDLNYFFSDASYTSRLFYNRTTNKVYGETTTGSGTGINPTQAYYTYYNTSLNVVRRSTNGTTWLDDNMSLPLCIFKSTQGVGITSITQVFNGFGYIGSTVFALPGVKALRADGRNLDGSLKNVETSVTSVSSLTFGSGANGHADLVFAGNWIGQAINHYSYNEKENLVLYDGVKQTSVMFGKAFVSSDKITSLTPKTTFHALDYNDKGTISGWGMPSGRYDNLTVGASGATYTAPANGWFVISKRGNNGETVRLRPNWGLFGHSYTSRGTNEECGSICPAKKGDVITLLYTASGNTEWFRFIYDEGEV